MRKTIIFIVVNLCISTMIGYYAHNFGIGLFAYFTFVSLDRIEDKLKKD
jgi:hypothetical protein